MRPALTIYCRRRSARGVTDCSESPLLRPDTDSVALAAISVSVTAPASPLSSAGIVSSLTRPQGTLSRRRQLSILVRDQLLVTSLAPARTSCVPLSCVFDAPTSPQLKQAAAASRSLSRPELTRKAEALNQRRRPAPARPYTYTKQSPAPGEASLARLSGPPSRISRFQFLELPVFTTAYDITSYAPFARPHLVALAYFPPPAANSSQTRDRFSLDGLSPNLLAARLSLFSSGAPSVPPETNSLCWSMP